MQGGKGAGLALQRTYNSDDSRIGPFGVGWTHAYDIRCEEENPNNTSTDATLNYSDRQDFFGGRQKYHRDADGLYTPPAYLYDEHDGTYLTSLLNGPLSPLDDTDIGQDGTIKHYQNPASGTQVLADYNATTQNQERFCDTIQDRYGNTTHLSYVDSDITYGGIPFHLLSTVTDPSGRQLTFHWSNVSSDSQPMLRITQVDGPQYSVTYNYTLASGLPDGNLVSVTLAPTVQRAIPTRA